MRKTRLCLTIISAICLLPLGCYAGSAPAQRRPAAAKDSPGAFDSIECFELDPKTSIPYQDRDRTSERYFHGFSVLRRARIRDRERSATVAQSLRRLRDQTRDRPQVVRNADYGFRVRGTGMETDYLLCLSCEPQVIWRAHEQVEVPMPPEGVEEIRTLLSGLFGSHGR